MADRTIEKRFLRALKGEAMVPAPFWLMRQAGRYLPEYRETRKQAGTFLELCYTPDLAVEVTLQPLRRYAMDAAILFSDILVIPDALGQRVEFREGVGPLLDPLDTAADFDRLDGERVIEHLTPVFETVRRLRQDIPADTALIGFAGAPWTVAIYMVEGRGGTEGQKARRWAYGAPDEFGRLIDTLVDATAAYLIAQVAAGAEALQIFDSWAGALGESQFDSLVVEPTARLVAKVRQACPGVPIIGFPRGAGIGYRRFIERTGVDGVSLDSTVPAAWAAEALQPLCTVQGNLDNQVLVAGGPVLDREVDRILDTLGGGPFIFNLGHGIVPETPPEHVARLADRIRARR